MKKKALRDKETLMILRLMNLQSKFICGDLYETIKEAAWEPEVSCRINIWDDEIEEFHSELKIVSGQFTIDVILYHEHNECFVISNNSEKEEWSEWKLPLEDVDVDFLECVFMEMLDEA